LNSHELFRCRQSRCLAAGTIAWVVALCAGFVALWGYAATPAAVHSPPQTWPADLPSSAGGRWTLLMFLHPRCPCSQASLHELERLQARAPEELSVRIVFVSPRGSLDEWQQTPLVRRAKSLPQASVEFDRGGELARALCGTTSGEALLYDPRGRLAYHGGITAARGHEGDNPGASAILNHLAGRAAEPNAPAFGCPLFHEGNDNGAAP
jgi:hypothetical protein